MSEVAERAAERKTRRRPMLKRAVELRMRGLSYEDIADKLGVAKSTVHEQLSGVFALLDPEKQGLYEHHRVSVLSAVEMKLVGALADDARLAKASLNNVAYAFTQTHQARRLEAGQSTANLALHELVERVERERRKTRVGDTAAQSDRGHDTDSGIRALGDPHTSSPSAHPGCNATVDGDGEVL